LIKQTTQDNMDDNEELLLDSDSSHEDDDVEDDDKDLDNSGSDFDPIGFGIEQRIREAQPLDTDDDDEDVDDDLEDEVDNALVAAAAANKVVGAYMPDAFKDLHVGSEIEELFRYIEDYKPLHLDLEGSGKLTAFTTALASTPGFLYQNVARIYM
jgi:hypothetical protein